jgi:hypothetical protein
LATTGKRCPLKMKLDLEWLLLFSDTYEGKSQKLEVPLYSYSSRLPRTLQHDKAI